VLVWLSVWNELEMVCVPFVYADDVLSTLKPSYFHCDVSGLQYFDAVGWAAGRASGLYKTDCWRGTGMVIGLQRDANYLHMVQLMPLPPHHLLLQ